LALRLLLLVEVHDQTGEAAQVVAQGAQLVVR
jgi:hypothetical protein